MEKKYSKQQLEDKALKSANMYFGKELLPYFNIGKRIRRVMPTEQIRLEAVRATEDILFEMEDDTLAHFEFESVEVTEEDLRRFRAYDGYTGLRYGKPVITYVICSGRTKRIHSELKEGINTYRIIPLQLKQRDADKLINSLKATIQNRKLTKADLAPLLLTPLMSGKSSVKERILEAQKLLEASKTELFKEEKQHMEAVLYTFACKFLNQADLQEVKEILSMTVLGEMIWQDGLAKGIEQGIEQGIEKGIKEGHDMGREIERISMVCRKLVKNKGPEQIAEELEEELPVIHRICRVAEQFAPDYDCEMIYQALKSEETDNL